VIIVIFDHSKVLLTIYSRSLLYLIMELDRKSMIVKLLGIVNLIPVGSRDEANWSSTGRE